MEKKILKVTKIGDLTYLPAREINMPEGIYRRTVYFQSNEFDVGEHGRIVATLWDDVALYDLKKGDKVLATLQFRGGHTSNCFNYELVDFEIIEKVMDY